MLFLHGVKYFFNESKFETFSFLKGKLLTIPSQSHAHKCKRDWNKRLLKSRLNKL